MYDYSHPAALLPDYAIAVIVIGALILLAVVFCGIGVCFACSNSKNKDSKSHMHHDGLVDHLTYLPLQLCYKFINKFGALWCVVVVVCTHALFRQKGIQFYGY